ncbi:hypothetical protein SAMN02745121_04520 [Nannocystis exedens]|uniref:Uncharacterized protein n=1 Tax=Nannocystis exedens TaxID=54 RepID=A0A1I2B2I3_9BACT|nr:hypothetical protein SAMN02745121_04520 [Nannocystis exedens]
MAMGGGASAARPPLFGRSALGRPKRSPDLAPGPRQVPASAARLRRFFRPSDSSSFPSLRACRTIASMSSMTFSSAGIRWWW